MFVKFRLKHYISIFLLLFIAFFLRLKYGWGLCFGDDFGYIKNVLTQNKDLLSLILKNSTLSSYSGRIGISLPLYVAFKMFGSHQWVFLLFPFLFSMGTIILAVLTGFLLKDFSTGLIAGIIITFLPGEIQYSTTVLPESFSGFYIACTMFCFVFAFQLGENKRHVSSFLYILSGIFCFFAIYTKTIFLFLFVSIVFSGFYLRKKDRNALFIPFASVMMCFVVFWMSKFIFAKENVFYLINYLYSIIDHILGGSVWPDTEGILPTGPFDYILKTTPVLYLLLNIKSILASDVISIAKWASYFIHRNSSLVYYFGWPSIIYVIYRMRPRTPIILPLSYFFLYYLFMEFGFFFLFSGTLSKISRYILSLNFPLCIICGLAFSKFFKTNSLRVLMSLYIIVSLSLTIVSPRYDDPPRYIKGFQNIFEKIKKYKVGAIYLPTMRFLKMKTRGSTYLLFEPVKKIPFKSFEKLSYEQVEPNSIIISSNKYNKLFANAKLLFKGPIYPQYPHRQKIQWINVFYKGAKKL